MANDEVLGPRKTMFVLVIVVGCFAVLWPRILSPLILGNTSDHLKPNKFDREAVLKQERPPIRVGPHPALRERGRAIPPGTPPKPVALPPHIRVRSPLSPLSVYYNLEIKPPPIPGMRPPLGSPGGPVPAPKTSMGFVMPIYTICIIVFFVYTLSKILFKRTGTPYDPVLPDPQFRRRVFRDDSRSSPEKLGHKETDTIVSAISGLVAEVRQQMELGAPVQLSQEAPDSTRPYTNGTIIHNSGPVQIVTSEYREIKEDIPELRKEKELPPEPKENTPEPEDIMQIEKSVEDNIEKEEPEITTEEESRDTEEKDIVRPKDETEVTDEIPVKTISAEDAEPDKIISESKTDIEGEENLPQTNDNIDLTKLSEEIQSNVTNGVIKSADFINEEREELKQEEESTQELLEEAIREESIQNKEIDDKESQSVKVMGMETTEHPVDGGAWRAKPRVVPPQRPHESEQVQSIFLETEIPQQSQVLVTDFRNTPQPGKDSPLVVSGKITLSLIQDTRGTPDRDLESTQDDFTTASAATHPAEKDDELSDEEIEEEIEIEEIEEEVEEEEEEEPMKTNAK